jgi:hypothetical protein
MTVFLLEIGLPGVVGAQSQSLSLHVYSWETHIDTMPLNGDSYEHEIRSLEFRARVV